ncbi:MAG: MutS-related protein [Eubacteriales bacterium]
MTAVKFPSLLWGAHSPTGEIDAHVFADLNLDKLLPEDTLNILALPCPPPLISARQRIFSLLCGETDSPKRPDDDFSAKFEALGRASVELAQAHVAYTSAQNKLELLLLFRRYAKMYIKFCKQAETLDTGVESELVSGFAACFRENAEQTSHIEAALDVTSPAEAKLSEVTLTFAPEGTMLDCATPREPVIDRIRRLAGSLGYGIAPRRQQSELRTEQFYSDALLRRMPDEAAALEAAAAYVNAMRAKRLPLCYPTLTCGGPAHYEELYDLYLCASYYDAGAVVPNDVDLSHGGILVTGANNTGKTVFLRSVGTAQLLAQAGLPVIARNAAVRMRSGVFSLYAAAEKEFTEGNDAGRFEQEVRLVAEMLDVIKPGALVLLNELFQTTAYAEGAEGLCGILRYLRSEPVGVDYIAVTHLTDLVYMLAGETVHMRTLEGEMLYKLAKVTD